MAQMTAAGVVAAIKACKGGEALALGPGAPLARITVSKLEFDPPVTITSADPAKPAVLTELRLTECVGIAFKGVEIVVPGGADGGWSVIVKGCEQVTFDRLQVHGSADGDPTNDRCGIQFNTSQDVGVTNSEFHDLKIGVNVGLCSGVTVANNNFHDIRVDGTEFTGCTDVLIAENAFRDFRHLPGDHSDAIQFWTTGRVPGENGKNITIRGNVIAEGLGQAMQGVFMADEAGNVPYSDVSILDNTIIGGNWNGITVPDSTTGAVVSGTVQAPIVRGLEALKAKLATASYFRVSPQPGRVLADNQMLPAQPDASDATVRAVLEKLGRPIPANIRKAFGFPTVDPRDARIAELEAMLAAVRKVVA